MIRDQVKAILDRVLTSPPRRQEDAALMLSDMKKQDNRAFALSDERADELRRRLAEKDPKTVTLAQFKAHLHRRYSG